MRLLERLSTQMGAVIDFGVLFGGLREMMRTTPQSSIQRRQSLKKMPAEVSVWLRLRSGINYVSKTGFPQYPARP